VILVIKVKPNSKKNELIVNGTEIICRVKAPAIDGKANEEFIKYLSIVFNISKSSIILLKGQGTRFKKVNILLPEASINGVLSGFSV
jgi:uncharacterized protein (TIGR00251 family)